MNELYVANTDNDWFDFLKTNGPFEEVNFWKPSQQLFKAIDEGGFFVFRLKSPRNVIGGYGRLVSSINAPIRLAWESLGPANGVSSCEGLIRAIKRYRSERSVTVDSFIGCRLLADPVFFEEKDWFPVPDGWSSNIVPGKVYSAESSEGAKLFTRLQERTDGSLLFRQGKREYEGFAEPPQAGYGAPILVAPRLGQAAFRLRIADIYGYKCAISDTKVLPALDSAHIVPFSKGGDHSLSNGILVRKDIHAIVDEGFATIGPEGKFKVSKRVRTIFNNGHEYLRLDGKPIALPALPANRPAADRLEWHRRNVFVGD
jgi:putative restriction endonuclease